MFNRLFYVFTQNMHSTEVILSYMTCKRTVKKKPGEKIGRIEYNLCLVSTEKKYITTLRFVE